MKTSTDPRHLKRRKMVQELFAWKANPQSIVSTEIDPVIQNLSSIDKLIESQATKWPKDKINAIDIAILRLAVYELKLRKSEPPKVIIDEAIELAREFGCESSSQFINGVLGALVNSD